MLILLISLFSLGLAYFMLFDRDRLWALQSRDDPQVRTEQWDKSMQIYGLFAGACGIVGLIWSVFL